VFVPSPIWPKPFDPQQYATPASVKPQVCVNPAITAANTSATLREHEPGTPSVVAEIVAVPKAAAVTKPALLTDAQLSSDDDHVNALPEIAFPLASRAVAVSCTVSPREVSVAVAGETSTDTTVGGGGGSGSVVPSPQASRMRTAIRINVVPSSAACASARDERVLESTFFRKLTTERTAAPPVSAIPPMVCGSRRRAGVLLWRLLRRPTTASTASSYGVYYGGGTTKATGVYCLVQ
jgi:hypothetical protein